MQLSAHFTLDELTHSELAERKGIDNTPTPAVINNLRITCGKMEAVRTLLKSAIFVSSGYRCLTLNRLLGSKDTSAHVKGWAIDFKCPGFGTPVQIVDAIKASGIKVDQVIEEGTWVHISFAPAMRQQFLKATFKNGRATYSEY